MKNFKNSYIQIHCWIIAIILIEAAFKIIEY